ncbi:YitT family protein [Paenibacillus hunanensis]|uniref:Uncharacterized membrane-anchored protein YitT (DUF2179 family) n=1 Tax=Paenibacillus hunanensis TaxID=539262 RepID=A0ABU1J7A3_9BACL|nr:YitT family protein [Paenibacillus hunanensis]MDR6246817.1 uncharacterized membrane-anchored protein YitT (DUF2179 family) [Paenibacillus hunanensis]GGJ20283.1 membrane protein [Paenibacillus hunanensis]
MLKKSMPILGVLIGSIFTAVAFNMFLIPHQLLSGGVSGLAMLTGYFTPLNISMLYFVYNIPLLIAGWFLLGKRYIFLSIVSVVATTWLMTIVPTTVAASDLLISSVFGGVLIGIGVGISFRAGGSTGGFDILGSIITRYRDFPVGNVIVGLNGLVIIAMGYLSNNWNIALASMVCIYIAGKVVDLIHVNHIKVTLFIVSNHTDVLLEKLMPLQRGVTMIKAEGAFSNTPKDMLMTVTTRYELTELRRIIKETDPTAFVNMVETVGIMGSFRKS